MKNIKRFLSLLLLSVGTAATMFVVPLFTAHAQGVHEFIKTIGGGTGNKIVNYNDGYIVTGFAQQKLFITRLNSDGSTLWSNFYPAYVGSHPTSSSEGRSLIRTSDGGIVAVGMASGPGSKRAYILKVAPNGSRLWYNVVSCVTTQPVISSEFFDVIEDGGEYVAVGIDGYNKHNLFIAKFNAATGGMTSYLKVDLQENPYQTDRSSTGYSIIKTPNGYAIAGQTTWYQSSFPSSDVLLLEVSQNLSIISRKECYYYTPSQLPPGGRGLNLIRTWDGGFVIVGDMRTDGDARQGVIIRIDPQGGNPWTKIISLPADIEHKYLSGAWQVKELYSYNGMGIPNGTAGYVIAGWYALDEDLSVGTWAYLLKLNSFGNFVDSETYRLSPEGLFSGDMFYSIALRSSLSLADDRGVAAVGQTTSLNGGGVLLVKTHGSGLNVFCDEDDGPSVRDFSLERRILVDTKSAPPMYYESGQDSIAYDTTDTYCYKYTPYLITLPKYGVDEQSSFERHQAFPNPAQSGELLSLVVGSQDMTGDAALVMTDILGRPIFSTSVFINAGQASFVLPNLERGTYTVSVRHDEQISRFQVVITK